MFTVCVCVCVCVCIINVLLVVQWNLSIVDTIGTAQNVLIKEVSSFQRYVYVCMHTVYVCDMYM